MARTDAGRHTSGSMRRAQPEERTAASSTRAVRGWSWRWNATGDERDRDDPGVLSRDQLAADPHASDPLYRFDTLDRHSFSTAFTLRHNTPTWAPRAHIYT